MIRLLCLASLLVCLLQCTSPVKEKAPVTADSTAAGRKWWKEAVVYQVYPRSFKDNNGDGVGDLKGILSKLDYIKSLGVDVVWLNPIYASPNDDNGYDISDYQNIMKEFGTMQDFDSLLEGMHHRGLRLVMDLVVNHSSSENQWFKQSRSSRGNPYRDYYHWWPAERGKPAKRYSFFDVNNDAWKFDTLTNAWYLHYFSQKQPDLNWENPALRQRIFSMMKFWFDKGVDGFRMDVIPFISKDTSFPDLPAEYHGDFVRYYANGPHLHEYLQEMNRDVLSKYDVMSVAEGIGVTTGDALEFVDSARHELNMLYHFEGVSLGYLPNKFKTPDPKGYSLVAFKKIYSNWDSVFEERGWGTIYLGNHDQPRMVTRWGNDNSAYRELSSKMLTTFLLTMRATPYYYGGDELAMNNIKFDRIGDYQDIESRNMYQKIKNEQGDLHAFLEAQKISARDNARTPFQWDTTANAGFTTGRPWLQVNPNYKTVNVATEEQDPNSPLNYFRKMVRLRKSDLTLVYGRYTLVDKDNPQVYAYTREWKGEKIGVLLNFSARPATVGTGVAAGGVGAGGAGNGMGRVLIGNYQDAASSLSSTVTLRPYEAYVYRL
jgi:oligo-1,6-glucosidase